MYMKDRIIAILLLVLGLMTYSSCGKKCISNDEENVSETGFRQCLEDHYEIALEHINNRINAYSEDDREKNMDDYCKILLKKAELLMLYKEKNNKSINALDEVSMEALKCYKEYFELKKKDVLQHLDVMNVQEREYYWMSLRPFFTDCYRIENADPAFLYDVTLFSKGLLLEYTSESEQQLATWEQVQQKLQPTDCAVEFIQYEKYGEKSLGALVLKSEGKPQFVWIDYLDGTIHLEPDNLVEAMETVMDEFQNYNPDDDDWLNYLNNIELLLKGEGFYLYDAVTRGNGLYDQLVRNYLYSDSTLFKGIWTNQLLEAIGKDTRRLYFAADGVFHILAIEYMLPNAPELTSLKTGDLYRLTSTRQLLVESSQKSDRELLLVGDIDYDKVSDDESSDENYANDEQAFMFRKIERGGYSFNPLPSSKPEIEEIRKAYDSTKTTVLTGTLATETRTVSLIKQHSIVHVSTHGFYYGIVMDDADILPANYNESLSESGIALAGCNAAFEDDDFDATKPDGLLPAREIAQMDFSNVDLMVLSACQTGLGYVSDEGVYGLQRGLKYAGVKSMILSLWAVDDEATYVLMEGFYRHLKTEDTHTAFMHAREELVRDPEFNKPDYYNAFILIDVK